MNTTAPNAAKDGRATTLRRRPVKVKYTGLIVLTPELQRIRQTLDVNAIRLAAILGENISEIERITNKGGTYTIAETPAGMDRLLVYVSRQIGGLVALRREIMGQVTKRRVALQARRDATTNR